MDQNKELDFTGKWILRNGMRAAIKDKLDGKWRGQIYGSSAIDFWNAKGDSLYNSSYDLSRKEKEEDAY